MFQLERNFVRHAIAWKLGCYKPYHPLCAYVYLTFRCNMACVYCNDGSGKKYPECSHEGELGTEDWLKVLSILKRETDVLIFTGGEPTMRRDLREVLEGCRDMGYRKMCFLTNGLTLERHPEVFETSQLIMISLDTLDEAKADPMMGAKPGTLRKILKNVDLACEAREQYGFKLYFNIVITPDNIDDVHDVLDFCLEKNIGFTPLPHIDGFYPREGLPGNAAYQELIDRVIDLKCAGFDVLGTLSGYVKGVRDFSNYDCLPTLLARVWPNGDLLYPCQKMHMVGANLLEEGDYSKAINVGIAKNGPLPSCDNRCHHGCYMDFSIAVQRPEILLHETWCKLKGLSFRPEHHKRNARQALSREQSATPDTAGD